MTVTNTGCYCSTQTLIDAYRLTYQRATGKYPSKRTVEAFLAMCFDASGVTVTEIDGEPRT